MRERLLINKNNFFFAAIGFCSSFRFLLYFKDTFDLKSKFRNRCTFNTLSINCPTLQIWSYTSFVKSCLSNLILTVQNGNMFSGRMNEKNILFYFFVLICWIKANNNQILETFFRGKLIYHSHPAVRIEKIFSFLIRSVNSCNR